MKKAFTSIITEFRPAFTLSSLYYHTSLLQPIIPIGRGPWIIEARKLGIPLYNKFSKYDEKVIHKIYSSAKKLEIPYIHRELVEILKNI